MNSSKMLRMLLLNDTIHHRLCQSSSFRRTFLSEAYACQEAWDKRLQTPLLNKIKPVDFFLEIDRRFQNEIKVHPVDIDIFANVIRDNSHIDELSDVLYKLRMTRETSWTLPSTHHAVVRYYLSVDDINSLMTILNDRLNYGIFCEYFDYNLIMDYCIKKEDYANAAKTSTFMMLQEEFENPLSNALALYSCFKYLENPDTWVEEDPQVRKMNNEPKEEVKIRVKYIINPFFDDHFDLWKPSDLIGKTLLGIGRTIDTPLGRSAQLRGAVLYKKYDQIIPVVKQWLQDGKDEIVYKEVISLIKQDAPALFAEDSKEKGKTETEVQKPGEMACEKKQFEEQLTKDGKQLKSLLLDLEKTNLYQGNIIEDFEKLVKKSVEYHAEQDIKNQKEIYEKWEAHRINVLETHKDEIDRQQRLEKVEQLKKELEEKEKVLTFFDKQDQIELEIETKLKEEKLKYGKDLKKLGRDRFEGVEYKQTYKKKHDF
ncbi:28S ribosomal protein S27, mitochondrial-like [Trichogramma pretiosum]|uniref:28S ribosomal protein S27, mitochondrial-like n=1 Tax=Trichogramma pretiosum TaxID=7493 RepID=UPI000C718BC9|nr:28S ribosomal protein S27, mitochondrial-like [Trichogramma pretiosum]